MASTKSLRGLDDSRADSYRYAVQPQLSADGLASDGRPIRKKKKLKKINKEDWENIKQEMDMLEHKCSLQELADRLGVNFDTGISQDRAKYTLERDGPNELSPPRTVPEWVKFSRHLFNGLSLMMWGAALLAFIVFSVESATLEIPVTDNLYLGFLCVGVVIIMASFSYYKEVKSSLILESFKRLAPQFATVYRKGEKMNIHAEELVVGDIVDVKTGDRIPADMRLIVTRNFKVDNSSLTGESEPKVRTPDYTNENPLETRNLVFYSTTVVEGVARGVVIATGDRTIMGRIANMAARMELGKESLLEKDLQSVIFVLTSIGTFISLLFFFLCLIEGYLWQDALQFLCGILIACVPEGLLPSLTVCLALAAARMSSKNVLVRDLESAETLGEISTICTDKSGTLTQNKMVVQRMWFDNRIWNADLSEEQLNVEYNREVPTWLALARGSMLCNKAELREEHNKRIYHGDPVEAAILQFIELSVGNTNDFRTRNRKVCEIPFNKSIKYQVSIHEIDDPRDPRYLLVMNGAPERVFDRCSTICFQGQEQRINSQWRLAFHNAYLALAETGESAIGVCDLRLPLNQYPPNYQFDPDSENFPQTGLRFLGMITTLDPPRASVPDAVERCKRAGIKVIMITGDHPITAKAIAKGVGIISSRSECADDIAARLRIPITEVNPREATAAVIHGSDLREMTPFQLHSLLINFNEIVFARTTPHQKLIIVEACQTQGAIVAVTGDGVNDSPAIKKADIGIAMGLMGTEACKEAANVILLDDNFASIVFGIEEGRIVYDNMKKCLIYTLTSNMAEMGAFMLYIIAYIPLPIGALTIFFIDLGTNLLPAFTLGMERPSDDVMARPPRDTKHEQLIDRRTLSFAYGQLGVVEMFGAFYTYFVIMAECGFWPPRLLGLRDVWMIRGVNDVEDAYGQHWAWSQRAVLQYTCQTGFFMAIVMQQWVTVIVCKFNKNSKNPYMFWALIFETLLLFFFVFVPGMDIGLRIYPLRWSWWFAPLPFVFLIVAIETLRALLIIYFEKSFIEKESYT